MIISASRRTDYPAFFGKELAEGIRRGYIDVPNPFRQRQIGRISLLPEDVDGIVLWTRNVVPFLPYLPLLNQYAWYAHYTVTGYGPHLEPGVPAPDRAIAGFQALSEHIGPERVIWRYDPVVMGMGNTPGLMPGNTSSLPARNTPALSEMPARNTPALPARRSDEISVAWHQDNFSRLAEQLAPYTKKCVISFLDLYRKNEKKCRTAGIRPPNEDEVPLLAEVFSQTAETAGIELATCAEPYELSRFGITHGACIDAGLLSRISGDPIPAGKDPSQREACSCARSRDIGRYGTCRYGCVYCYARA
jgi:hypothetical protein